MTVWSGDALFGPDESEECPSAPPANAGRVVANVTSPQASDVSGARPRVVDDVALIGLTRVSLGKIGSRVFTWFFVLIFALIVVQMVVTLLEV